MDGGPEQTSNNVRLFQASSSILPLTVSGVDANIYGARLVAFEPV